MTILVDHEIRSEIASGNLILEPFDDALIQPNSYDVRLANHFSWHAPGAEIVDPYDSESVLHGLEHETGETFVLQPGQFVLGATLEKICLPNDIVGQLTGKSSLARLGVMVHVTAGFIDAGFSQLLRWSSPRLQSAKFLIIRKRTQNTTVKRPPLTPVIT
jgi:dCTP deaminase